jgi:hypothetical protein
MEHEYLFDAKLLSSIRVKAKTQVEAEAKIREIFDVASCNGGAWPDGGPVLFEASVDGRLDLVEVDGELL